MAVDRDRRLVDVAHVFEDAVDEGVELRRRGVADGVRDVYGRGAGVDHAFEHAVDVLPFGARRVHGAELDVLDVAAGAGDHRLRGFEHGLAVLGELVHEVDVG